MSRTPIAALGAVALLAACEPLHRVGKFFAPPQVVLPAENRGGMAAITVSSGWKDELPASYEPAPFGASGGLSYERPVPITEDGWIEIAPSEDGVAVTMWIRHVAADNQDFQPVVAMDGGMVDRVPNELRPLPVGEPLRQPWYLTMRDLANVYAPDPLADGDLLLVTLQDGSGRTEHYLFDETDFGFRTRLGAGVLVRLPVPFIDDPKADTTPILAGTMAIGYRPRTRAVGANWVADQVSLVVSLGIGSTAIDVSNPDFTQLGGTFNAGLVGGGLELFQFISGQVMVNLSSLTRQGDESHFALAVGVDAVQLGRFAKNSTTRLLKRNALVSPPPP